MTPLVAAAMQLQRDIKLQNLYTPPFYSMLLQGRTPSEFRKDVRSVLGKTRMTKPPYAERR